MRLIKHLLAAALALSLALAPLPTVAAGWLPLASPAAPSTTTTLNPLDKSPGLTLSGGNLSITGSGSYVGARSISSYSSGKKYMELTATGAIVAFDQIIGLGSGTAVLDASDTLLIARWLTSTSTCDGNGGTIGTGLDQVSWTPPNTAAMAVDIGNLKVWFRISPSGLWNNSGTADPANNIGGFDISYLSGLPIFVLLNVNGGNSATATANFGATAYLGTPPAGFTNW